MEVFTGEKSGHQEAIRMVKMAQMKVKRCYSKELEEAEAPYREDVKTTNKPIKQVSMRRSTRSGIAIKERHAQIY